MREYGTYIFDLDNTIVDSSHGMEIAFKKAFAAFDMIYEPARYNEYISTPLSETFARYHTGDNSGYKEFVSIVVKTYDDHFHESFSLFCDAEDVIRFLHSRGKKMGIVSNSITRHINAILSHLGVRDMFGSIVGVDRCPSGKPDPCTVLLCLGELGSEKTVSLMTGDSENDVWAATRAGIDAVHIDRRGDGAVYGKAATIDDLRELLTPYRQS